MGKKGAAATVASGKAAAVKEESSSAQDFTDTGVAGAFSSEVSQLCNQHGIPPIAVYSRGSGGGCRFAFMVDVEVLEQECITAIHVRGWMLSDTIATILLGSLANVKTLTCLSLWNVGLSSSTLFIISQLLSDHNIRELSLDGNALDFAIMADILQSKSLVKLSMKNCGLTDAFAQEVSPHLATNVNLLHLNMSCNSIGDDGCASIAGSLRLNRTLLTLSLTGNLIRDNGVIVLSKVLSRFPLNHSEVVQRRKFLSLHSQLEDCHSSVILDIQVDKSRVSSPRGKSPNSTTALQKSSSKGSGVKGKKGEQKKEEKSKREDRTKKTLESKKGKTPKDVKSAKRGDHGTDSPRPDPKQTMNPLSDPDLPVKSENGQLYIPGNTTLLYLALSYNQIGITGIQAMLEAIRIQKEYSELGTGLLRIALHHNAFRVESTNVGAGASAESIMTEIESLLVKKNLECNISTDLKKETE